MKNIEGLNRTGIAVSPMDAKEMIEGAISFTFPTEGDAEKISKNRIRYMEESGKAGSVPPPATVGGAMKTGLKAVAGKDPLNLIDKVGERLAFERAGVRLYDALISKWSADQQDKFPFETLERIRDDELRHFHMLEKAMEQLGGDPTAVTPSANVMAVASMGLQKVMVEPRISFEESLEAILIAELADNDGWSILIQLAEKAGNDELVTSFQTALIEEEEHLETIRGWVEAALVGPSAKAERQTA